MKDGPDFDLLRQGAHHALRDQKEDGSNDLLATLIMKALEPGSVPESAMLAASEILKRMGEKP